MKKIIFFLAVCIVAGMTSSRAQDIPTLLKEGIQLERQQKKLRHLKNTN